MNIKSNLKEYEVIIEEDFNFIHQLIQEDNILLVIDKNVYEIYYDKLFKDIEEDKIYIVEAIEQNKTIETALKICERMTSIPAKRNSHLISIGGGIIQDLTGFAANILYRGVMWTFVPTTLLAACDSCIGGKTSLNYLQYKNLLGTFYPPDSIHICSEFFQTLTERDFQSGLGEVVKFNVMYGEEGLTKIELSIDRLLNREKQILNECIVSSLAFKKPFIEEDEFDKGIRIHLNFAHTFGHAFESMSQYVIPHGTAVAMGTIVANRISMQRGMLKNEMVVRMEAVLKKIIHVDLNEIKFDIDKIINAIRNDKKQTNKNLTAILLDENMKLGIYRDIEKEEIKEAVEYLFKMLS